jgi:hypothetical protein
MPEGKPDILQTFGISILPDLLSGMVEAFLKLMKYFVIVSLRFLNSLWAKPLDWSKGSKKQPLSPRSMNLRDKGFTQIYVLNSFLNLPTNEP